MIRSLCLSLLLALALPGFAAGPEPKAILLVAKKNLPDPFFANSVVLVTNYGRGAPIGVIINRPTEVPLATVFSDIEGLRLRPEKLFFGGPVRPEELIVVFRAAVAPTGGVELLDGVYLSSTREVVRKLLARENPFEGLRVFAGHAGWAPGQLEAEIERGDWHLAPADARTIFDKKPEGLWQELERKASAIMTLGPAPSIRGSR